MNVVYKKRNLRVIDIKSTYNSGVIILQKRFLFIWIDKLQYTYISRKERQGYILAMYNELNKSK